MSTEMKNKIVACVTVVFFLSVSVWAWLKSADAFSESERRELAQLPEVTLGTVKSGTFMAEFEDYTLDQFPMRDLLRTVKAVTSLSVFRQSDNHDIYIVNDYASKLEYPLKEASIERTGQRFQYVYDKYMAETDVKLYFSIIPDKNYFLAEENGYLSLDYDKLFQIMSRNTEYMKYIDITGLLSLEDYYRTDTHWRQERLVPVAEKIGQEMGVELTGEYEVKTLDHPFYGVYYGQSALPLLADEIQYLTSKTMENCVVYDFQNGKSGGVYDMEKAYGKDSYEMFLSGSLPLLTIENPDADLQAADRELIIFRDSFGSSIAPLFIEGYARITLVDIRYIHPDLLKNYIRFDDQDVLFLYSTLVLNNGETIK